MRPAKPRLRLRKTCRGSFKIYSIVETGQPIEGRTLTATATKPDGTEVPAITYPFSDTAYVLVLAVLEADQQVTLELRDGAGSVLASSSTKVSARLAQLSSQAHTLMRDATVERIRNFDLEPRPGHFDVTITRMVREEFETYSQDIIQGEATLETDDAALGTVPVSVTCIDRLGNRISLEERIIRDTWETGPADEGPVRRVQFSVRIGWPAADFLVWVHAEGSAPDTALLMDLEECTKRRNWWRAWTMPVDADDRYPIYFDTCWKTPDDELARQREDARDALVSVVVPLTGHDLRHADDTVESVLAQTHASLELVLVDCTKGDTATADAVERWCRRDPRVRSLAAPSGRGRDPWGIAAGIAAAAGEVVCVVREADTLAADALWRYVEALADDGTAGVVYSDEDSLEGARHVRPFFKPTWEPDLLLGIAYVAHPLCMRRSLLSDAVLAEAAAASTLEEQEHFLALEACGATKRVTRIPRVLYHVRGRESDQLLEHVAGSVEGVRRHLAHAGIAATAAENPRLPGTVEVTYDLETQPRVSILIPNRDATDVLGRCMDTLLGLTAYQNFEVIIIENNSVEPETFAYYDELTARDERVRVVRFEGAFNYAAVNDFGAEAATGDYLVLLNNDTEVVDGGWLSRMVAVCSREGTGIVGAKLLFADGTVQHGGVFMRPAGVCHRNPYHPTNALLWDLQLMQDVTAVTAACLMVRREAFDEVGGLDAAFAVDYNDVDFCWKVLAGGLRVVYDPGVTLIHAESVSRGKHVTDESKRRFKHEQELLRERWPDHFGHVDPATNPNLDQLTAYTKLNAALLPEEH